MYAPNPSRSGPRREQTDRKDRLCRAECCVNSTNAAINSASSHTRRAGSAEKLGLVSAKTGCRCAQMQVSFPGYSEEAFWR